MCDYSLNATKQRLAVDGEELVSHRFRSGSVGMMASADTSKDFRASRVHTPSLVWGSIFLMVGVLLVWLVFMGSMPLLALSAVLGVGAAVFLFLGGVLYTDRTYLEEECAVCLPPGARLLLIADHRAYGCFFAAGREALFTELSAEPDQYRDALVFPAWLEYYAAVTILLHSMGEGMRVRVLSTKSSYQLSAEVEGRALDMARLTLPAITHEAFIAS